MIDATQLPRLPKSSTIPPEPSVSGMSSPGGSIGGNQQLLPMTMIFKDGRYYALPETKKAE